VINCSEPVRHASHVAFLERFRPYGLRPGALATCYAMAENVFAVTQGGIEAPLQVDEIDREAFQVERLARPAAPGRPALNMLSNGRPVSGVAVRVLAPQGDDLPDRRVGEIAIRSDCMLSEYYHRPDVTAGSSGRLVLTGDFVTGEGECTFGVKSPDIVGGKNVYPQDLEELAMLTPGVHPGRVSAFGVFDEAAGTEDVVIVAEVDSPDAGEREQIVAGIRQNVTRGSAVALRQVYLVGPHWLVKTSSGKTARPANKDKYLAETLAGNNIAI
jgi:acyl-CoA synthetase (AMP-forming)/AMP-acid ligase II